MTTNDKKLDLLGKLSVGFGAVGLVCSFIVWPVMTVVCLAAGAAAGLTYIAIQDKERENDSAPIKAIHKVTDIVGGALKSLKGIKNPFTRAANKTLPTTSTPRAAPSVPKPRI